MPAATHRPPSTSVAALLEQPATDDWQSSLDQIRRALLLEPLPSATAETSSEHKVLWKLLLRMHVAPGLETDSVHPLLQAAEYIRLIDKGPSAMLDKIKEDASRTFATDKFFAESIEPEAIIRVLEAFVWRTEERQASSGLQCTTAYVQGMNVLAATFLHVTRNEVEAFACLTTMVEQLAPRYFVLSLDGVHDGLELVDRCLELLDPELFRFLREHAINAELCAFATVLTFSASTPPLIEVVALWDFLLAWGVGLNVLCVVAQLSLAREELMGSAV
ncbi:CDC16 protein [Microbotryomycetes sp. JL201]|nr:CDC16 protein [Microbotryomycetes sp. JL201]